MLRFAAAFSSVDPSRVWAVASIGIYARLRFSQPFINITHPLYIHLLLFASIKSRMFTKSAPVPNKHLSYLSLVWYSVSPPPPHLVEKEWRERRQRGIHCVLNYLPRIVHLPVHYFKIESPSPLLARGYPTHDRPLHILSAPDRLECGYFSWSDTSFLGHDGPLPPPIRFVHSSLSLSFPERIPQV